MGQDSTTAILIAAMLIWGVAMSIATWARYKHVGKQLTRPTSLLLAGGIWLAIFMLLTTNEHYAGNAASAGIFLVALACYAILRMGTKTPAHEPDDKKQAIAQATGGGFENGMLLSVSLGVFIFASQFSGIDNNGNEQQIDIPTANSQTSDKDIDDILNAAEKSGEILQQPTAYASSSRAIRLEDGWNISLFHYDPSSDTVKIEAVTAEPAQSATLAHNNTVKAAPNNWHQISNVKVVSYPDDMPATWIEVELSPDDINTLRFAAETGAISIYSE